MHKLNQVQGNAADMQRQHLRPLDITVVAGMQKEEQGCGVGEENTNSAALHNFRSETA